MSGRNLLSRRGQAAVAGLVACAGAGPAVDPATLPWAVRVMPGGEQVLLLDHSPIGIAVPAHMTCGQVTGGPPIIVDGHGQMYLLSSTPLDGATGGATTRPGDLPRPTLDELAVALKAVAVVPVAGSLTVEQSGAGAYQVRCLATNCHGGKVTVIDRGRVVASQRVDCLVPVEVDFAPAVADAAIQSATLLGRARVVQRRAVSGHAEAADAATGVATGVAAAVPRPAAKPVPAVVRPTVPAASAGGAGAAVARLNARAAAALAVAQKLREDAKDVAAYDRFKAIVKQYPTTPAAADAAAAVSAYEGDEDFMAVYRGAPAGGAAGPTSRPAVVRTTPAERAKALLLLGDQFAADGQPESAKEKYREVIAHYPTFAAAAEAKDRLAKMGTGGPP